jgi:hypothetical protein
MCSVPPTSRIPRCALLPGYGRSAALTCRSPEVAKRNPGSAFERLRDVFVPSTSRIPRCALLPGYGRSAALTCRSPEVAKRNPGSAFRGSDEAVPSTSRIPRCALLPGYGRSAALTCRSPEEAKRNPGWPFRGDAMSPCHRPPGFRAARSFRATGGRRLSPVVARKKRSGIRVGPSAATMQAGAIDFPDSALRAPSGLREVGGSHLS